MSKTSGIKKDGVVFSSQKILNSYTTDIRTYDNLRGAVSSSTRSSSSYSTPGERTLQPQAYSASTNSARESYRALNAKLHSDKKINKY